MKSSLTDHNHREIHCCGCQKKVEARLTSGSEVYPHRPDLHNFPFWKCDVCGNYVGCHHKTDHPTTPLGCIPTPEIKHARKHIHAILDPLWQSGRIGRKQLYGILSERTGRCYHTAHIRSLEEAREIYREVKRIRKTLHIEGAMQT